MAVRPPRTAAKWTAICPWSHLYGETPADLERPSGTPQREQPRWAPCGTLLSPRTGGHLLSRRTAGSTANETPHPRMVPETSIRKSPTPSLGELPPRDTPFIHTFE